MGTAVLGDTTPRARGGGGHDNGRQGVARATCFLDGPGRASPPATWISASFVYLDEFEPVKGSIESDPVDLDGKTYPHALATPLPTCPAASPVTWLLPRGARRLLAEIGVSFGSPKSRSRVKFLVKLGPSRVYASILQSGEHAHAARCACRTGEPDHSHTVAVIRQCSPWLWRLGSRHLG